MNTDNIKKQIQNAFDKEDGIIRKILCCSCHHQDKKAVEAFKLLYPGRPIPDTIKGRDRIYQWAKRLDNPHLIAISKLSGKYAYYVELENDKIVLEINLITGRRTG